MSSHKHRTLWAQNKTLWWRQWDLSLAADWMLSERRQWGLAGRVWPVGHGRRIRWHALQLQPYLIKTTEAWKWKCQHFERLWKPVTFMPAATVTSLSAWAAANPFPLLAVNARTRMHSAGCAPCWTCLRPAQKSHRVRDGSDSTYHLGHPFLFVK